MSRVKSNSCSSVNTKTYYIEPYDTPRYIVYEGCCGRDDELANELMKKGVIRAFICATTKEFRVIDYTPDYLWRLEGYDECD